MIFFRNRRIRKALAARRAAEALLADAVERRDTRAQRAATDRLRNATHALMKAEGFGG